MTKERTDMLLKWITPIVLAVSIVGTTSVAQYRLAQVEEEVEDISDSVDENEKLIQQLQLNTIKDLDDLDDKIQEQGGDIKVIRRLLEDLTRN